MLVWEGTQGVPRRWHERQGRCPSHFFLRSRHARHACLASSPKSGLAGSPKSDLARTNYLRKKRKEIIKKNFFFFLPGGGEEEGMKMGGVTVAGGVVRSGTWASGEPPRDIQPERERESERKRKKKKKRKIK